MAKTLGTLTTTPDLTCITWKDAKRQIRAACKANNVKAVGFFRPRKANRGVLLLGVEGGTVTATTARLSGRIRTAAADVRDADLVRLVAARLGQDTSGADAAGPDTAGPDTAGLDAPGIDPTGRGAGGDSRTGDDATPRGSAQPSPEVEEAVEEGEREVRADAQADDRSLESLPGTLRIFDVVSQSIEAMQSILTGYRMAGNRPDVLVEVPSDSCSAFDFHRAEEMIELGRRLTAEALDREGL